ncbi:MAG: bifunctional precorrin-2 dehydrogenase/sirohydrochlorin ferrochelatase [candidate division Zixibacteria bacterium]|nr:bifunctional precorrin-2 dehydrogenase/sirohydrochlorin ferrochelatase [candidate division Zixibacteria bacterium]
MANKFMPINLSLKDRACLIVGGGNIAHRKINTLLDYECKITVVAAEPNDQIKYFDQRGYVKLEIRKYKSPEASSYGVVIAASDDMELNKQVSEDCKKAGVPINVVDAPKLCDFTFPAVLKRDCLTVAVSTDGKAPFLAGQLRLILETVFPERWKKIANIAADYRKQVIRRWKDKPDQKVECYDKFLNADWKTLLEEMNEQEVQEEITKMIELPEEPEKS